MEKPLHYIDFGTSICSSFIEGLSREWLVTNGIGGYASGTIAGPLSRSYHGLLIAATRPPVSRTLLLSKLDETIYVKDQMYPLYSNLLPEGAVKPDGYTRIERFHLEYSIPVWTYSFPGGLIEKRIWMQPGENTTYIRYTYLDGSGPIHMRLRVLVNHRNHHEVSQWSEQKYRIKGCTAGVWIESNQPDVNLYVRSHSAEFHHHPERVQNLYLPVEDYRGLPDHDDHLMAGYFDVLLHPCEMTTIVASTTDQPLQTDGIIYNERLTYESSICCSTSSGDPDWIKQLHLTADQFIVDRKTKADPRGNTIIAGYHWFTDWGRDTMISFPGLTLATHKPHIAEKILRTFAEFIDQGMLPNRFPDETSDQEKDSIEYNTVDATLWYFEAMRAYYYATQDLRLLGDLWRKLEEIIQWHLSGTRYNIHADPSDSLLAAGEVGVQLTWMDAKVDDWVVTPRIGKPIEINALWYNAVCIMVEFAQRLNRPGQQYQDLKQQVEKHFQRFWDGERGYLFDVIDGPKGNDRSLRPNQLFAVSLFHSPLSSIQQRAVVDVCSQHLLTPFGLRSLSADDPAYIGKYGGDRYQRDAAYHQGTVWGWLIGPYLSAHWRVYQNPQQIRAYLELFQSQLRTHGLASISEIFDGDPPHNARGCISQAWSVAEILRVWDEISK